MATQEKPYELIFYFLLFAVIVNIALFIASNLHWLNPTIPPQLIGGMLLVSLLLFGIYFGIFMFIKRHKVYDFASTDNNYIKLILIGLVTLLLFSMIFGIVEAKYVVAGIVIIFFIIYVHSWGLHYYAVVWSFTFKSKS